MGSHPVPVFVLWTTRYLYCMVFTTCEMLGLSEDDPQWRYIDPDNNMWTLFQQKLDGEVNGAGACLIKNYYVKN